MSNYFLLVPPALVLHPQIPGSEVVVARLQSHCVCV